MKTVQSEKNRESLLTFLLGRKVTHQFNEFDEFSFEIQLRYIKSKKSKKKTVKVCLHFIFDDFILISKQVN